MSALGDEGVHHAQERKDVEVRIGRPDLRDSVLPHQCGSVKGMHDVAAQGLVHPRELSDDFRVTGRGQEIGEAGSGRDSDQEAPRLRKAQRWSQHSRMRADTQELVRDAPGEVPGEDVVPPPPPQRNPSVRPSRSRGPRPPTARPASGSSSRCAGPRACVPTHRNEFYEAFLGNTRQLLDELHVAWHRDDPWIGPVSPFRELHNMVRRVRRRVDGSICMQAHWQLKTRITLEEGLRMMTRSSAYALFREDDVGSLEPGKLADLVVVTHNPLGVAPEDLWDVEVTMTVIGGEVVFCGAPQAPRCPNGRPD